MKKLGIILFCLVLFKASSFGQKKSIYLQYFVKVDTVQLRWAPSNADLFLRGLNEGYEIIRTNTKDNSKKTFTIAPFQDRKTDLLKSTDTLTLQITSFVDEFSTRVFSSPKDKQMPYFMLSLAASTNSEIAQVTGLTLEDLSAGKGNYSYEIKFFGEIKSADKIEIDTKKKSKNPNCSTLIGSSRIDLKEVYLEWEAKSLNGSYGGYWLYKSLDGKRFEKLNETPLYFLTSEYEPDKTEVNFVDTAVVEGKTYYYQVLPINHFGDIGEKSNVVEVYIQKRLNGICVLDTVESDEFTRIIKGDYRTEIKEDKIKEFILYRSTKVDSGFIEINRQKTDDYFFEFRYNASLRTGDRHYFKVAAISEDGDTALSFPYYHFTLDQEPPEMPTDFKGIISDKGIVKLTWTPPADSDIQGYRVFRTNSLKEEIIEVTTHLSTRPFYIDTLRLDNLTSEIYYLVRTVDLNYNNSELTEPILLLKPDTIPPVASLIINYKVKEQGVYLEWANSQSEDLEIQYLLRTLPNNKVDTILVFKNELENILDTTCAIGVNYEYAIYTFDKNGNSSFSESLPITYEIGYRKALSTIKGEVNKEQKSIDLSWNLGENQAIYSVQIYRSKNNGNFKLFKTIRENVSEYTDSEISLNNVYHYKIKIMYQTGHSSKMSEKVSIVY